MHLDLAHALVTAALLYATITVMQKTGIIVAPKDGGPRWNWRIVAAVFVVVFILNFIWPYGS